jgi:L-lactate dehydrogenase complex protein LldE
LFPQAGLAAADVLERLGYEVDFPEAQTCCGQPAFNSGYRDEARAVADHFLKVFDKADYVVVPAGSCCAMIGHHYAELYEGDAAKAAKVRDLEHRVWEFSRFLTEVAQVEDVGARFPHKVTYHDSCHALRELGVKGGPRRLLAKVRDLELVEMEAAEECCGFGGTFSVKFGELSGGMAQTKITSIQGTGAEYVVSADSSCLMQLQGRMLRLDVPVKTIHLAEVLASR